MTSRYETVFPPLAGKVRAQGTDKDTVHSYGTFYRKLFETLDHTAKLNILEIGVFSGAFTQGLSKYFPNSQVVGMDISFAYLKYGASNPNIMYVQTDAKSEAFAKNLRRTFDIVTEDASHRKEDQLKHASVYAPLLAPGGTYVIEDIKGANLAWLAPKLRKLATELGLSFEVIDLRENKKRYDDILAVLRKSPA